LHNITSAAHGFEGSLDQRQRWRGDAAVRAERRGTNTFKAAADDVQGVFGGIGQNAAGSADREAAQAGDAGGDTNGQIEGVEVERGDCLCDRICGASRNLSSQAYFPDLARADRGRPACLGRSGTKLARPRSGRPPYLTPPRVESGWRAAHA